jgi:predicted TPR repeat methyltransferase
MSKGSRDQILENVYSAKSPEELERAYDAWAERYDEDVFQRGYMFPSIAAGMVGKHVPAGSRIVDAGAGTGIMGRVLKAMEYDDITGFDLSNGMLKVAGEFGIYSQLDRQVIGEPLKYETDSFDACVSIGTFTEGHAPVSGYDEIYRIVKPGGHFILSIREDVYQNDGFQAKEQEFAAAGKMKLVDRSERFRLFSAVEPDIVAHIYVYQFS